MQNYCSLYSDKVLRCNRKYSIIIINKIYYARIERQDSKFLSIQLLWNKVGPNLT